VNVLVDTSVWSLAFRRAARHLNAIERAAVEELTELVNGGRAKIIGPIRQELLSGIKTSAQFEELCANLRSFPDEGVRTSDYEEAARASNLCRSKGIAPCPVDILICAMAGGRKWSVFTTDPDFAVYRRALSIQLHQPRG
jgi:predicted nucleic acid-binding protein